MIDFDEATRCWLQNKRRIKGGTYKYTCEHTYKYGKRCGRDVYKTTDYCPQHYALKQSAHCESLESPHHSEYENRASVSQSKLNQGSFPHQ